MQAPESDKIIIMILSINAKEQMLFAKIFLLTIKQNQL
jgi:hypothetical protein